ncbi:glycosyltransferase [Vibrio splendidus]|uniref:glycosyltransferase n=1 Tax=Vibrio splendidus TaxID=29497 RepID=UPI000E093AA2|nr:glycosyltransferase [Vibrio splendidus]
MKILINASNLHVGGGVQVAASFVNELSLILAKKESLGNKYFSVDIIASTSVNNSLGISFNSRCFDEYSVLDSYGFNINKNIKLIFKRDYDVVFNVFGPVYYNFSRTQVVTGFAQAWIAYPNNLAYNKVDLFTKLRLKLSFIIKELYFKRSNKLIVEASHIKTALVNKGYSGKNIEVVPNAVSSLYDDKNVWKSIDFNKTEKFTLGFLGRNYSHKNIAILKEVNTILNCEFNVECDFIFTFSSEEMLSAGFEELSNFKSVGELHVEQCPNFYKIIDALIFPSLLECFSSTPVEAMMMDTLVIASDLPFVTEVCKDSARYFDPTDPRSIAVEVVNAINEPHLNLELVEKARSYVAQQFTAKERACNYLSILLNSK